MKHINVLCEALEADAKNSIGYIVQTLASNNISVCSTLTLSLYLKKLSARWVPRIFPVKWIIKE